MCCKDVMVKIRGEQQKIISTESFEASRACGLHHLEFGKYARYVVYSQVDDLRLAGTSIPLVLARWPALPTDIMR